MLRTEADMVRTLANGTYTVRSLYELAEAHGLADRPGGRARCQDGQAVYKRRVRTALQHLKRTGRAQRVGDGSWLIEGTAEKPRRCLLILLDGDPGFCELVLGEAAEILAAADEPIDLIVADPPWAMDRRPNGYLHAYNRDRESVVGGYVEVDPERYADFTRRWLLAAADAIRPGGYLAAITGPQQAARVQLIAEDDAGLTYVNSIAAKRTMGLYTTRRYVHSHTRITLLTKGPLDAPTRWFERPPDMPLGRTGHIYAEDVWLDVPDERRIGALRYDNALSRKLVRRLVQSCSRTGDLVADPFLGSGTTAVVCYEQRRRFYGGDLNPQSLRFAMARMLDEEIGERLTFFDGPVGSQPEGPVSVQGKLL